MRDPTEFPKSSPARSNESSGELGSRSRGGPVDRASRNGVNNALEISVESRAGARPFDRSGRDSIVRCGIPSIRRLKPAHTRIQACCFLFVAGRGQDRPNSRPLRRATLLVNSTSATGKTKRMRPASPAPRYTYTSRPTKFPVSPFKSR